jgi:hypothetical protein
MIGTLERLSGFEEYGRERVWWEEFSKKIDLYGRDGRMNGTVRVEDKRAEWVEGSRRCRSEDCRKKRSKQAEKELKRGQMSWNGRRPLM